MASGGIARRTRSPSIHFPHSHLPVHDNTTSRNYGNYPRATRGVDNRHVGSTGVNMQRIRSEYAANTQGLLLVEA